MKSRSKNLFWALAALLPSTAFSAIETGEWDIGNFKLSYEQGSRTGQIKVLSKDGSSNPLWATRFDETIIDGIRSDEKVSYSRGSFSFNSRTRKNCRKQEVTSVIPSFDRLELAGKFTDCKGEFFLTLSPINDGRLQIRANVLGEDQELNHTVLHYSSDENEGLYGFGTQYSRLNMKGELLPIWSQEQGIGRGRQPMSFAMNRFAGGSAGYWYTTYTGVPSYISTNGGGLLVENQEYVEFDFKKKDKTSLRVWSDQIDLQIIQGDEPKQVLQRHTEVSGRMSPLPAWTQNGVIARGKGGSKEVREMLAEFKEAGTPVAAVWIEDWPGERSTLFGARIRWNWQVDRVHYPDFEELVQEIRDSGIRVMTYFNPMLVQEEDTPKPVHIPLRKKMAT